MMNNNGEMKKRRLDASEINEAVIAEQEEEMMVVPSPAPTAAETAARREGLRAEVLQDCKVLGANLMVLMDFLLPQYSFAQDHTGDIKYYLQVH